MNRCKWCLGDSEYIKYHDEEWGKPVHDDSKHFEFLVLESAQAGLSWLTILKRRENYRKAYANFDYKVVAEYNEEKIEELLNNEGIIRNEKKIRASINNAKRFIEVQEEFESFDNYIWSFVDNKVINNSWDNEIDIPAKTELSDKVSSDLKKRGFKFLGSITIYAHLQAIGIINDHVNSCYFK